VQALRRTIPIAALGLVLAGAPVRPVPAARADPLPSWHDGPSKRAILAFVSRVTTEGGPDFVPPAERIATFDNDGTLWPEQPVIEGVFALEKLKAMAARDSSLRQRQPFKAMLEGDRAYLSQAGPEAVLELITATHGSETEEQYEADVRRFFQSFRYPKLGLPLARLPYQPQVELLRYLRVNGFETWISSGGEIDFMREISETLYGIPPEQVIGSTLQKEFVQRDGRWVLWRKPALAAVNDKTGKPVGIDGHIGRRPIFVAGNVRSGGDIAMMQYSRGRAGPSLQILINHDDSTREFAYAEKDTASLKAARQYGFTVVSMKGDWRTIFSEASVAPGRKP
jgi:hypothetical protein